MFIDILAECVTTKKIDGVTVENFCEIVPIYAKGSLIVDLVACLPGLLTLERYAPIYILKLLRFLQITRTVS